MVKPQKLMDPIYFKMALETIESLDNDSVEALVSALDPSLQDAVDRIAL